MQNTERSATSPSRRKPQDRQRTHWRHYVPQLVWEHLRAHSDEQQVLSLFKLQPEPE